MLGLDDETTQFIDFLCLQKGKEIMQQNSFFYSPQNWKYFL